MPTTVPTPTYMSASSRCGKGACQLHRSRAERPGNASVRSLRRGMLEDHRLRGLSRDELTSSDVSSERVARVGVA